MLSRKRYRVGVGLLKSRILLLLLAGVLAVPAVAATGKSIDLTGVVGGKIEQSPNSSCSYRSTVSLLQGKHNVGTLDVDFCGSAGFSTHYSGTAAFLKVGKIKGTAHFGLTYTCPYPCNVGTHAKYGTGNVFTKHASEGIRVNSGKGLPTKKGTRFKVVLTP